MKPLKLRAICAAFAAVLTLTLCPFSASAESTVLDTFRSMGDADGDGVVSVTDAQSVLKTYVNALSRSEKVAASTDPASDTNMDGEINLLDASNILKFYCRTMAGDKPLWSEFRDVSKIDGCYGRDYELEGMFLEIGVASGKPGDVVAVPVYLSGVSLLAGFQLFINQSGGTELINIHDCVGRTPMEKVTYNNSVTNPDAEWGCLVWISSSSHNVKFEDVAILAEYLYRIPEDAEPGTVYSLSIDKQLTSFITAEFRIKNGHYVDTEYYQFTLLDGAIHVD